MQSLMLSPGYSADAVSDQRKALVSVAERSQALLATFEIPETIVEPMAALAIELDRAALVSLAGVVELLLVMEQYQTARDLSGLNSGSFESMSAVISATEHAQKMGNVLNGQIESLRKRTIHPGVKSLADEVRESLDRMFKALESDRWAAMERQADIDVEQGRVRKFGNASAAIAHLRRIAR